MDSTPLFENSQTSPFRLSIPREGLARSLYILAQESERLQVWAGCAGCLAEMLRCCRLETGHRHAPAFLFGRACRFQKEVGEGIMRRALQNVSGVELLLKKYRCMFWTTENLNHSSRRDFEIAERKFLKHALTQRSTELKEELSNR
jgi:hypothetical protein